MELFLSDLDNTLIYSYKKDIGPDKVLVETKEGKALSFMTAFSHRLLRQVVKNVCFVPVTTRSLEQYRRICFFPEWEPPLALAANGGLLLRRGEPDPVWYQESLEICAEAELALSQAERILEKEPCRTFEVRRVDGLFVFTKSSQPQETAARLQRALPSALAEVQTNGAKIYVLPRRLNKGTAVVRLRQLLNPARIIAAGDSEFDIPMLMEADVAWFPSDLAVGSFLACPGKREAGKERLFSDQILEDLAGRQLS